MSGNTAIGWTDATWNPVTGCSHVSPGCEHCYAEAISLRFGTSKKPWTAQNAAENVVLHPERLTQPLKWRTPRRVFVNSMSDLFHEQIPDDFIDSVFAVMMLGKTHTYQVLTKRPERMRDYLSRYATLGRVADLTAKLLAGSGFRVEVSPLPMRGDGLCAPNVWLGVSVEDQRRADERIPILLDTPAAVRFISAEPLLGPVNLCGGGYGPNWLAGWDVQPVCCKRPGPECCGEPDPEQYQTEKLDWVIVGAESGPNRRPFDLQWARDIQAQCAAARVAYFFKQTGALRSESLAGVPPEMIVREYPATTRSEG